MPSLGWRQLPQSKISVGCELLDAFLRGGIPCGSITELVGKSQTRIRERRFGVHIKMANRVEENFVARVKEDMR